MLDFGAEFLLISLAGSLLFGAGLTFALAYTATGTRQLKAELIRLFDARITTLNGGFSVSRKQRVRADAEDLLLSIFALKLVNPFKREDEPAVCWARAVQLESKDFANPQDYHWTYKAVGMLANRAGSVRRSSVLEQLVQARITTEVDDMALSADQCESLEALRTLFKRVTTVRRTLFLASIRSNEYRRLFHPIYNSMIDSVARGTTAGLLLAACLGISESNVDEWIAETARYPIIGGAVGSVIFAAAVVRSYDRCRDDDSWRNEMGNLKVVRYPVLAGTIVPLLLALLLGLMHVIELQLSTY